MTANLSLDDGGAWELQPECIQILDRNGAMVQLNAAGRALLGAATLAEVRLRPFVDFVAAKDRPAFESFFGRVLLGQAGEIEFTMVDLTGGRRSMGLSASPLRKPRGAVAGMLGILRDVSLAGHMETELKMIEHAINRANDAIFLADDEFHFIFANDTACQSLGYSREELAQMSAVDIDPNVTPELLMRIWRTLCTAGELRHIETLHRARNGRIVPVEINFSTFQWSGRQYAVCVARYQSMETSQPNTLSSVTSVSALMESTSDCVVRYDLQCRRINVNPAMQALFRRPLAEVLGRTPEEVPLHNTGPFMKVLRGVLASGCEWRGDMAYTDADGRTFWGDVRVIPEFSAGQQVVGALGVCRDITHLRRLEEELRQLQKLAAVGQLTGGVAHDFNNTLAAILLHLTLLRSDPRVSDGLSKIFKDLEDEARRATQLPRQLLMFSRPQAMQAGPTVVEEVMETTLRMLRRVLGEKVAVEFRPAAEPVPVLGDAAMLEQVILNLCLNARDAMPQGGRITVSTEVAEIGPEAASQAAGARPGTFVRLCVADTGCGMDARTQARIFEPFFTTKKLGRGTGLGLTTVQGIVRQHHGWIRVESVVGQGSAFSIFLPVHRQDGGRRAPVVETAPAIKGDGETVLLVEDEASVRRATAALMHHQGYEVLEAQDGSEATKIWDEQRDKIDVLFSDMVIPGCPTGMDLAQQFKRGKPALKVILSSGYPLESEASSTAKDLGVTFLAKPFTLEELSGALRSQPQG